MGKSGTVHADPALEARLAGFADDFRQGRDFIYGIFNRDETEVLGGTGLHPAEWPSGY